MQSGIFFFHVTWGDMGNRFFFVTQEVFFRAPARKIFGGFFFGGDMSKTGNSRSDAMAVWPSLALHRALRRMAGLVFLGVFWVLAGAFQRHGVGGFLLRSTTTTTTTTTTHLWVVARTQPNGLVHSGNRRSDAAHNTPPFVTPLLNKYLAMGD